MDEDMLEDQRELVALLSERGWDVTDVELSAYDSPWEDSNDPEATITLTARKPYDTDDSESASAGSSDGDDEDDNPFRIQ